MGQVVPLSGDCDYLLFCGACTVRMGYVFTFFKKLVENRMLLEACSECDGECSCV